jgi:hypothetical protein
VKDPSEDAGLARKTGHSKKSKETDKKEAPRDEGKLA